MTEFIHCDKDRKKRKKIYKKLFKKHFFVNFIIMKWNVKTGKL